MVILVAHKPYLAVTVAAAVLLARVVQEIMAHMEEAVEAELPSLL
jgi:hypothetical protein